MFDSWFRPKMTNKLLLLENQTNTKVSPSVKATSVSVIFDDINNEFLNDSSISEPTIISNHEKPFRSASISLSIELAKKTSMSSLNNNNNNKNFIMQKPDTPQSSLPKNILSPSSIHSANSLLQKMAHSPKAAPAIFPTSVSANGNVTFDYDNLLNPEDNEEVVDESLSEELLRSPAMKSLKKRINYYNTPTPIPQRNMDELTEEEVMNTTTTTTPTVSMNNTDDEEEILENKATDFKTEITATITPNQSTCENKSTSENTALKEGDGSFWSWLGFSSSETVPNHENNNNSIDQQSIKKTNTAISIPQQILDVNTSHPITTTTTPAIATATTIVSNPDHKPIISPASSTSSSWFSSLFKPVPKVLIDEVPKSSTESDNTQQIIDDQTKIDDVNKNEPIAIKPAIDKQAEDLNLRKVKSTSTLPSSSNNNNNNTQQQPITLRNSASITSLHNAVKKKNKVLPPFHSQFFIPADQEPPQPQPSTNILTKAFGAINSILIPTPPADQPEDTSNWIAKRMRTKFSHFIEDMKIFASTDPMKKAMVDKRIVIVGVHGWFPMKLVRSMIGEPTGTSIKFCEQMAAGVKLYFESEHQVTLPDEAITLVPLEGEGKVEDRVNHLYAKLLDNSEWLEAVSSADVVLWATHSQGTPVSMMLLQRLLERGHIHIIRQSVCVLAMAGISHGPFPALKGSLIVKYFEADAARELFEFMDSNSPISIKYRQSLSYLLKCGIKLVLMGSLQDQVVPLYSAIISSINHPNILRSLYIDGHIYSKDDFLINLVLFAVKLRNAGLSDHDLLTYLSEVLAGSLYALEGGHSTIYEELEVYMTAIRYTFETTPFGKYARINKNNIVTSKPPSNNSRKQSAASSSLMIHMTPATADIEDAQMEPFQAKLQQNPFYLPWALHAIICDPFILADELLKNELSHLLTLFEHWNPTSNRLKELKFRLDPLRTVKLS